MMISCNIFKNYVHKISSRNSTLYKLHIKIFLESFASIYHLYHLFGIIYKSIFYKLNSTLNHWFISKSINIRSNFIYKSPLGPWFPAVFSYFSVIKIFKITSYIFALKCFSCSNSLVLLPIILVPHLLILGNINQTEKSRESNE